MEEDHKNKRRRREKILRKKKTLFITQIKSRSLRHNHPHKQKTFLLILKKRC
jgi:hypothetical protein